MEKFSMSSDQNPNRDTAIGTVLKRLRTLRHPGHGGTKACSGAFGVSPQLWSDWEAGRRVPNTATQRKLQAFFAINPNQLHGEEALPDDPDAIIVALRGDCADLQAENERLRARNDELARQNIELAALVGYLEQRLEAARDETRE